MDKCLDKETSGAYSHRAMTSGVPTMATIDPEAGSRLRAYMEPRIGAVLPWAERHGIGRDTVYALWRGREPQPRTLRRVADAIGVPYDELLRVRAGIEEAPAEAGAGELVAAIRELTAAILGLRQLPPAPAEPRPTQPRRAARSAERQAGQTSEPTDRRSSATP